MLDTVIKLTGAERAYLMLTQGENRDLRVHVARNNRAENLAKDAITFSHQIIDAVIEQRSPIVSTNAQEDDRFTEMKRRVPQRTALDCDHSVDFEETKSWAHCTRITG